jgi:hypothetical protein
LRRFITRTLFCMLTVQWSSVLGRSCTATLHGCGGGCAKSRGATRHGYGCSSLHGVLCDAKEASRKESCQWVVLRKGRQLRSWGCWRAVHNELFFEVTPCTTRSSRTGRWGRQLKQVGSTSPRLAQTHPRALSHTRLSRSRQRYAVGPHRASEGGTLVAHALHKWNRTRRVGSVNSA